MLALTIASSVYGVFAFQFPSLCGDIQSFPFSPGAPGAPSFPGLHSTGTTIVPPGSHCSPSAPSTLRSIHPSLSPGMSSEPAGLVLSFHIQEHPTPSWSGYLTMSRYSYVYAQLQSFLGLGDFPSSPSFPLGSVRSNSLIVGDTVLIFAAAVPPPVTSPILRSIVSPSSHFLPGCPSSPGCQFAPAGIWNVKS